MREEDIPLQFKFHFWPVVQICMMDKIVLTHSMYRYHHATCRKSFLAALCTYVLGLTNEQMVAWYVNQIFRVFPSQEQESGHFVFLLNPVCRWVQHSRFERPERENRGWTRAHWGRGETRAAANFSSFRPLSPKSERRMARQFTVWYTCVCVARSLDLERWKFSGIIFKKGKLA